MYFIVVNSIFFVYNAYFNKWGGGVKTRQVDRFGVVFLIENVNSSFIGYERTIFN